MRTYKIQAGFTLIETLVAVAIIGIIASLVVFNVSQAQAKARDSVRKSDVDEYNLAINNYETDTGTYFIMARLGVPCDAKTPIPTAPGHYSQKYGSGCVGKFGNSYGLINAFGDPYKTDGYNPAYSIATALVQAGTLPQPIIDPFTAAGKKDPTDPTQLYPDFYYSICQTDVSKPASAIPEAVHFTVSTRLEILDTQLLRTQQTSCGGIAAGQ